MINMKLNLPDGTTGFYNDQNEFVATGSRMGRPDVLPEDINQPVKLRLEKLKWVSGGYDQFGAYWGRSKFDHIFCAWNSEGIRVFVRDSCREYAKQIVRAKLPKALFYR